MLADTHPQRVLDLVRRKYLLEKVGRGLYRLLAAQGFAFESLAAIAAKVPQGVDFNQVLVRFAPERIFYRLTQSLHADRFLLKDAVLFKLWYDMPHRITRDADLLGFDGGERIHRCV